MGVKIAYSDEELLFIKSNKTMVRSVLTKQFNKKFNRDLSVANIASLCKRRGWMTGRDGRFSAGHKAWNKGKKGFMGANKTSFKKGDIPRNQRPVGSTRITRDGYIAIKVKEPRKWELLHRKVYIETNGKIPRNHIIAFKNGDKTDCRIDNLILINRSELAVINHNFRTIDNKFFESKALIAKIEIKSKEATK